MDRPSAVLDDEALTSVELTQTELRLLDYVIRRAQEDPSFFGAALGGDRRADTVFKLTMGRIKAKLSR